MWRCWRGIFSNAKIRVQAEQVAQAHTADLEMGAKFGVQFLAYWFDADQGAGQVPFSALDHHVPDAPATVTVISAATRRAASTVAAPRSSSTRFSG